MESSDNKRILIYISGELKSEFERYMETEFPKKTRATTITVRTALSEFLQKRGYMGGDKDVATTTQ